MRYGEAHPDAPAIILAEFQAQAAHRRRMEQRGQAMDQRELDAAIASERSGLVCALLIALVGFGCDRAEGKLKPCSAKNEPGRYSWYLEPQLMLLANLIG